MPITVNEGGVLYEQDTVTANEGGVLYELDSVHVNEGGTLCEIFSKSYQSCLVLTSTTGVYYNGGIVATWNDTKNSVTIEVSGESVDLVKSSWTLTVTKSTVLSVSLICAFTSAYLTIKGEGITHPSSLTGSSSNSAGFAYPSTLSGASGTLTGTPASGAIFLAPGSYTIQIGIYSDVTLKNAEFTLSFSEKL